MGKKDARAITFQYADAFTPYGPMIGRSEGFSFFTLRPISSGGFFAMPGNRKICLVGLGATLRDISILHDQDYPKASLKLKN